MSKHDFLKQLRKRLTGLPKNDIEERLAFYGEMIDDRMEEGLSEEEAVSAVGSVDETAQQIIADMLPNKNGKVKAKSHKKVWQIVLLVLGSPVWISLLIAALAVVVSLYVSMWTIVISIWAVSISLLACAVAGVVAGVGFAVLHSNFPSGIATVAAAIICSGIAILFFLGSRAATRGMVLLTKWMINCFRKKGGA